jgi:hypothetical protein
MPTTWDPTSAADGFKGKCLNLADAAQGHVGFEYAEDFVHGVVDDCPNLRIDLDLVVALQ